MKLYLARPISGQSFEEVVQYYESYRDYFYRLGYEVMHPMTGKQALRTELEFKAHGYDNPVSTNHAILERDKWMVQQCDVMLCDLSSAGDRVSIGCMMEIAWACLLNKHVIVVMDEKNIHNHAFVLEAADIVLPTITDAQLYLDQLSSGAV